MSLDQKIESISNSVFSFVLSMLPTCVITGSMKLYIYLYDTLSEMAYQTHRTTSAIQQSFYQPILAFYNINSHYIPVGIQNDTRYSTLPEWIYTPHTNEFSLMESDQARTFRLPFIAATLYHKKGDAEVEMGDMSEWIAKQTICAPNGIIPLQILVAAWMYVKDPPTLLMSYDDLYLKVMNDSAEETMYHVESEKEVKDVEDIEDGEIVE